MDICAGCRWCEAGRLPEFADEDELMEFLARHPATAFAGIQSVAPWPDLAPRARARALEAAQRLRDARVARGRVEDNPTRTHSRQLVSAFAKDLIGAAI